MVLLESCLEISVKYLIIYPNRIQSTKIYIIYKFHSLGALMIPFTSGRPFFNISYFLNNVNMYEAICSAIRHINNISVVSWLSLSYFEVLIWLSHLEMILTAIKIWNYITNIHSIWFIIFWFAIISNELISLLLCFSKSRLVIFPTRFYSIHLEPSGETSTSSSWWLRIRSNICLIASSLNSTMSSISLMVTMWG